MTKIPQRPPSLKDLLSDLDPQQLEKLISSRREEDSYWHWDELRRRKPPEGLTVEEWWLQQKVMRGINRRNLPFADIDKTAFSFTLPDEASSLLHEIDQLAAGRVVAPTEIVSDSTRDRYLVSSLMEEAISSSLLEGAATTRQEAKQLLRSGREPVSKAERMVVNNYRTMNLIRSDLDLPLSAEMVLEIHRTITEGTLHDPDDAGRLQQEGDDRVVVAHEYEDVVYHRPPPAAVLPERLDALVKFANAADSKPFLHPVIRAVALHFWLAYDHPFVDGNGRAARALFYRSMLRQGYWLTEFLSISRLLYQAPAQYERAFLFVESDDADLTYFIVHQLRIIRRSIDELYQYLSSRAEEIRELERQLGKMGKFNMRQLALLAHALKRPDAVYTFQTHQSSHQVVYETARRDLLDLEILGLLERGKVGREYRFFPARDLGEQIRHLRVSG
jgi:Fic family protein